MKKIYRSHTELFITNPFGELIHFNKNTKGVCIFRTRDKEVMAYLEKIKFFNKSYRLVETIKEDSDDEVVPDKVPPTETVDGEKSEDTVDTIAPTEVNVANIDEAREILKQRGYENFLRSWSEIDEKAKSFSLIFKR